MVHYSEEDTKRAALGYAVALIASLERTASHFGVNSAQLKGWLRGETAVPKDVFLNAVELLLKAPPAELATAKDRLLKSDLPAPTPVLERLLNRPR